MLKHSGFLIKLVILRHFVSLFEELPGLQADDVTITCGFSDVIKTSCGLLETWRGINYIIYSFLFICVGIARISRWWNIVFRHIGACISPGGKEERRIQMSSGMITKSVFTRNIFSTSYS